MKGACWSQGAETYACSSLGFQRQNKCVTINCEKGGHDNEKETIYQPRDDGGGTGTPGLPANHQW